MSDLDSMESLINEYTGDIDIPQVTDEKPGELEQENETTFVINSIEDLVVFSYNVRSGTKYEGQTVKLGVNLDFKSDKSYVDPDRTDYGVYGYDGNLKQLLTTGEGFIPIGEQAIDGENYFYGTFDGDNNVICSLYENINTDENLRAGLFSTTYGKIQNLGIVNTNINVKGAATIIGGLTGGSYNDIHNSCVTGSINVIGSSWVSVGGLCGNIYSANIENCYNLANINCQSISTSIEVDIGCGGITGGGYKDTTIDKCFNGGDLIANSSNTAIHVAGICSVTHNEETVVKNCYNFGDMEGITQHTNPDLLPTMGGIISVSRGSSIKNCYNFGKLINNIKVNSITGGIVGYQHISNSEISNVFNLGKIEIKVTDIYSVGGILGVRGGNIEINIIDAYNIGKIEANSIDSSSYRGAITGTNTSDLITFNNCYYLKSSYDIGLNYGLNSGIEELDNISEFPSVLEVVNKEGTFKEDANSINNGYPILSWQ